MTANNLLISIQEVEFAKDYQYFITVQFANDKKRTDLSAVARAPVFTTNNFLFPIKYGTGVLSETVTFTACLVLEEPDQTGKGQSKILGEAIIDLSPYGLQTSQVFAPPIRQQMKFSRMKEGREVVVGRFIATFKIVAEQLPDSTLMREDQPEFKPLDVANEVYEDLPDRDDNFSWRVRLEIRSAQDIPTANDMTPQALVETGWSEYKNTSPQQQRVFRTKIVNSPNPVWNSSFLITNPVQQRKGFIAIILKDKNVLDDLAQTYIPVESMTPFVTYNLHTLYNSPSRFGLYISVTLEAKNPGENLHEILIQDVVFEPLPSREVSQMALVMSTSENTPSLNFYTVDEKEDSIQRILQFDDSKEFLYTMSQVMRLPPSKSRKAHRAVTFFTVPERMLTQKLKFYMAINSLPKGTQSIGNKTNIYLPSMLVGQTVVLDDQLLKLFIDKSKKRVFSQINYYKTIQNPLTTTKSKCQVQIGSLTAELKSPENLPNKSQVNQPAGLSLPEPNNNPSMMGNGSMMNGKQMLENNTLLNRLLKEIDDKTESLKISAAEIVDLRKQIKLLQSENNLLRRDAEKVDEDIREMVSRQVETMGVEDLKEKLLKISSMYKNQRIKVKSLQNNIKTMEPQVANTMQLNSTISTLNNHIQVLTNKLLVAKKDVDRIGVYKETIKKQEKVIERLERVATDAMKDIKRARSDRLELEELKKKMQNNQTLQNNDKNNNRNSNTSVSGQRYTANRESEEIQRLHRIIASLQSNMRDSAVRQQPTDEGDRAELEFRLHKAEARVSALEEEITNNARNYAKELAKFKLLIAEKQALLDGFSIGV